MSNTRGGGKIYSVYEKYAPQPEKFTDRGAA